MPRGKNNRRSTWLPSGGHHTHDPNKDAQERRCRLAHLLLLEDVCVFAQTQLAEKLGEVGAFEAAVQVAAIASCQGGNAVHVVAAAEIMLSWRAKERQSRPQGMRFN